MHFWAGAGGLGYTTNCKAKGPQFSTKGPSIKYVMLSLSKGKHYGVLHRGVLATVPFII